MLGVVVENLVANSIRYAGEEAVCTIACTTEGGRRLLVVSDNGRGVPDADLPRLFERFYRGDRGRSTRGTGLGLAIVKHVVAAGGGTVDASRSPGGGLAVTCSFPSAPAV
jgi:signal transduction histidine kinase